MALNELPKEAENTRALATCLCGMASETSQSLSPFTKLENHESQQAHAMSFCYRILEPVQLMGLYCSFQAAALNYEDPSNKPCPYSILVTHL